MTRIWLRRWRSKDIDSVLEADFFDLQDWMDAQKAFPRLTDLDQQEGEAWGGHPVQDGFFSLYKREPRLREAVPSAMAVLREILGRAMATPNWKRLHDVAQGDMVTAAVGAEAVVRQIFRSLPEEVKEEARKAAQAGKEAQEAQKEVKRLMSSLAALQEAAEAAQERGDAGTAAAIQEHAQAAEGALAEAKMEAEQAEAEAKAAVEAFQQAVEKKSAQVTAALNRATEGAAEKARQTKVMVQGYTLAAGGDPQHISPEMARAAMEVFRRNPHLQRLAEMLGWARRTVRAEWRQSPRGRTQFTGYRTGYLRPEHLAPVEWVALASGHEALETDFFIRAAEGALRHRHFEGKEKEGRGPLVIVRDESGSMSGAPHALAVALEWALLEVARRDRRDFYSIPFSGFGQYHVWKAPDRPDPEGLLRHLAHFYGGGTEPYTPLKQAMELIEEGDLRADVLLITDDQFGQPPQDFLNALEEARRRRPLKVVTVLIGTGWRLARTFSDRVVRVDNFVAERERLREALRDVV